MRREQQQGRAFAALAAAMVLTMAATVPATAQDPSQRHAPVSTSSADGSPPTSRHQLAERGRDASTARQQSLAMAPAQRPTPSLSVEAQRDIRLSFGLGSTTANVDKAMSNRSRGDVEAFGLALTPAEPQALMRLLEVGDQIPAVQALTEDTWPAETFGGVWIEDATFIVGTTEGDIETRERELREHVPSPELLMVRQVDFSYFELTAEKSRVLQIMEERLKDFEFFVIGPDPASNRVKLRVPEGMATEAWSRLGDELGPQFSIEEVSGTVAPAAHSDGDYYQPTRGGLEIRRGLANGPQCTSSFVARRSNGTRWLLTAGHCGNNENAPLFFQGGVRINPLEHVNQATCDTTSVADVGGMNLVSALWGNRIWASHGDSNHPITAWHARLAVTGGGVQLYGSRSNTSALVNVQHPKDAVFVRSNPFCDGSPTLWEQVKRTNNPGPAIIGGDSGGPVFQANIAEGVIVLRSDASVWYVPIQNQLNVGGFSGLHTT